MAEIAESAPAVAPLKTTDGRPLADALRHAESVKRRRALLLVLPLAIFTMIAIRLESPGPVIYRQRRVGLDAAMASRQANALYRMQTDWRLEPYGHVVIACRGTA